MIRKILLWFLLALLVAHGIVCILGAFFPFYVPIFLFYYFFPGSFAVKLIMVLLFGAAQVVFGIYFGLGEKGVRVKWYWAITAVIGLVLLLLIFPVTQGLFSL